MASTAASQVSAPADGNGNGNGDRNGDSKASDFWTTETYSDKVAPFVAKLTTKVVDMLAPQAHDTILDLGCGDGLLTDVLATQCQGIVGIDASTNMIESMRARFPHVPAFVLDCGADLLSTVEQQQGNAAAATAPSSSSSFSKPTSVAEALRPGQYSAVFSNAALHWILRAPDSRAPFFQACHALLKPRGRVVAEAGGFGNVPEVRLALVHELVYGQQIPVEKVRAVDPWWFASVEDYRTLVEAAGLEWIRGELELRQTKLTEGPEGGARGWMALFGTPFASLLPGGVDGNAWKQVLDRAAVSVEYIDRHPADGVLVNYVRVRFEARKPN